MESSDDLGWVLTELNFRKSPALNDGAENMNPNQQRSIVPLFPLGQVVATPGAINELEKSGESARGFLQRHIRGDWGDVCGGDGKLNDAAVRTGERILSTYRTTRGERIWIIAEADRSVTTLLLPSEY